jgi:ATP-dependent Zn protease
VIDWYGEEIANLDRDDYTSDMPEDQIPETVKDIIHIAKKESQPWFNEISDKVRATAKLVILKEDNQPNW